MNAIAQVNRVHVARMLQVATKGVTDLLLKSMLDRHVAPHILEMAASVTQQHAVATLTPMLRSEAGVSIPLNTSLALVRKVLACAHSWEELSRVEEYDDRCDRSIQVQSDVRLDAADPLARGRPARIRMLFILVDEMPQLRSCLVEYEQTTGSLSPISLVGARTCEIVTAQA